MNEELVPISKTQIAGIESVPAILERAGANAVFAADEFFSATINNEHTRRAYGRVVKRFLAWRPRALRGSVRRYPA